MTDSMKFGPEWLRNLSQEGCSAPAPTPRYQLAEHRYGREEMLALFDTLVKAPDPLSSFPGLYVDKTQVPLALIQMTEEETRHWNRGINSDAVLRGMGKGPPASVPPSLRGTGRGGPVGPSGLADRGRGRGRGGFTSPYSRGLSYDESGDLSTGPPHGHLGAPPGGYTRTARPFDRSQNDRNWGDRNGMDTNDWTATSPRKDFTDRDRSASGTGGPRSYSGTDGNWRRHRNSEDEDGWRTMGLTKEKWGGAGAGGIARSTSWRDGDRERDADRDRDLVDGRGTYSRSHRSWEQNNLPEWAVDGADSGGGTFDSQGAFHGGHTNSDEEDSGNGNGGRRTRLLSEGQTSGSGKRTGQADGSPSTNNNNAMRRIPLDRASSERASERLTPYLDKNKEGRISAPSTLPHEEGNKADDATSSVHNSSSESDLKSPKDPGPKEAIKSLSSDELILPQHHQKPTQPTPVQKQSSPPPPPQPQKPLPHPLTTSASMPAMTPANIQVQENHAPSAQVRHKTEDAMERMQEFADDIVAKLMEDEEGPSHEEEVRRRTVPILPQHSQIREAEKWFYRDPQGQVQGPFGSEEMGEWFRLGYFNLNLLVRRAKDECFSQLQDLIKVFGAIPFLTDADIPPIKGVDPLLSATPLQPPPTVGIPGAIPLPHSMPKLGLPGMPGVPGMESDIIMMQQHYMHQQQHQQQQQQQQHILLRQQAQAAAAVGKLSQSEGWSSLSAIEQQQLVAQHMSATNPPLEAVTPFLNTMGNASTPNSVLAMISQYGQKQSHQTQQPHHPQQQRHQQVSPPPTSASDGDALPSDPIQRLLRQLGQLGVNPQQAAMQQQAPIPPMQQPQPPPQHQTMDSLWGNAMPVYPHRGWLAPQVGMVGVHPGVACVPPNTTSLWGDISTKEMKTEKQILEEQQAQMRVEEERKLQEQLRKQQEEEQKKRLIEDEARKRREAEEAAAEAEKKRKKLEEAKRKEEEMRRKEELRKAEEERKLQEEKKRLEAARKKEEDKKKKEEEKRRKDEEKERKRREEDEKRRKEEERLRKEREEEELEARRIEAQRQAQALRKLQEQQRQAQSAAAVKTAKVAPWSQAQTSKPSIQTASISLAEIQRNQKREKEEKLREQQMILQEIQSQQYQMSMFGSALSNMEAQNAPSQMQLKWAEQKPPGPPEAKTLEQIQREEHERITKQLERDRAERAATSREVITNPSVGIWGAAPQNLTWGNSSSTAGFWDEVANPVPPPVKATTSNVKKSAPVKSASTSNMTACVSSQQSAKNVNSVAKKKKDEDSILKLFEQSVQRSDEFSQWCHKTLASLQPSVDIPTFVSFLRDIESPYEVRDYVHQYLGESEPANDFARQFLERRSKWRSERRSKPAHDDLCAPAPAVNPTPQQSHDFQEVKSKGKKAKKGKMYKVDSRILGFSVTAATDRINVGDRDYGEGI